MSGLTPRSNLPHVRNPLVLLPAFRILQAQKPFVRLVVRNLMLEISADSLKRAELCWRRKKAPMAAYWKSVSVYAKHAARGLR
jgi:hypothetical protein